MSLYKLLVRSINQSDNSSQCMPGFNTSRFGWLIAKWLVENMISDMTPYWVRLDVEQQNIVLHSNVCYHGDIGINNNHHLLCFSGKHFIQTCVIWIYKMFDIKCYWLCNLQDINNIENMISDMTPYWVRLDVSISWNKEEKKYKYTWLWRVGMWVSDLL
jgi:hypothetical protein